VVGIERLVGDIGNELVRRAGVVLVMVIAQCEVAEFHVLLPVIVRSSASNWNYPVDALRESNCIAAILIDQRMNGFAHIEAVDLSNHDAVATIGVNVIHLAKMFACASLR